MTAMKERANRWAGTLTTRSSSGKGTTVCLVLPLPPSLPTGLSDGPRTTVWTLK